MKIKVLKLGLHDVSFEDEKIKRFDPVTSATVYVEGKNKYIIDPGHRFFTDEIIAELAKEGVKPEDIDYVINTHEDMDHTQNNFLFKNAEIIVMGKVNIVIWSQTKPRGDLHKLGTLPFDEIKIIKTNGHRENHISVVVESDNKTYVIAGDAIQEEGYGGDKEKIDSANKIISIADVIIPGHGKIIEGKELEELKKVSK